MLLGAIPQSFRSSSATSPPTAASPLSETSCAAAQTRARPTHTDASQTDPGLLQRDVVSQRVVQIVHVVLAGDREIGVQRNTFIGARKTIRMTDHKLLGALLGIPFRRRYRQMARIKNHRKIGAATLFVGGIDSRIQTLRKIRAHRCRQMTARRKPEHANLMGIDVRGPPSGPPRLRPTNGHRACQ